MPHRAPVLHASHHTRAPGIPSRPHRPRPLPVHDSPDCRTTPCRSTNSTQSFTKLARYLRSLPVFCARKPRHGWSEIRRRHTVPVDRRRHGARDARGLCISRTRHGPQEEPGQRAREDPGRLLGVDARVFLHRLHDRVRCRVLRRHRHAVAAQRLRARALLLPADLRGGDSRDRVRRHRRACEIQSAARRDADHRRLHLSVLRRDRLERALRRAGLAHARVRCAVP